MGGSVTSSAVTALAPKLVNRKPLLLAMKGYAVVNRPADLELWPPSVRRGRVNVVGRHPRRGEVDRLASPFPKAVQILVRKPRTDQLERRGRPVTVNARLQAGGEFLKRSAWRKAANRTVTAIEEAQEVKARVAAQLGLGTACFGLSA